MTFVGRSALPFEHIRIVGPVASEEWLGCCGATTSYIAASRDDPCSNACSRRSRAACPPPTSRAEGTRSSSEQAGFRSQMTRSSRPYSSASYPSWIDFRSAISVPAIGLVADRYLEVLELART